MITINRITFSHRIVRRNAGRAAVLVGARKSRPASPTAPLNMLALDGSIIPPKPWLLRFFAGLRPKRNRRRHNLGAALIEGRSLRRM